MEPFRKFIFLFTILPLMVSCVEKITNDNFPDIDESSEGYEQTMTYYAVNTFAYNVMDVYYLWIDEIKEGMDSWKTTDDPISKVAQVRYKDAEGKDIDRWTQVTDNFEAFTSSVAGVSTTFGYDFSLYYYSREENTICAVVTYVNNDSPAASAGMKRGDVIVKVNGRTMTEESYYDIAVNEIMGASPCSLDFKDGKTLSLTPVKMYEDPVLLYKIFECGPKKVGYLVYNSFTLKSYERLIEACRHFRRQGVTELILDMRYNGGGYVTAEMTLASMLAPAASVAAGSVFEKTVYNSALTDAWGADSGDERLSFEFKDIDVDGKKVSYNTADANIGINKLYAILSTGSASASESLLVGLIPYLPVTIIGERSHGKYCSGIMLGAVDWYDNFKRYLDDATYKNGLKFADDWGIYVMIGRYADKNGNTPCMPDGFVPDIEVADDPTDGFLLGDPQESMLKVALQQAGYEFPKEEEPVTRASLREGMHPLGFDERLAPASFGKLIKTL